MACGSVGAVNDPRPIVLDKVELRFGARRVAGPLSGVFLSGSLTAVIGPNGAGKTTLLRALAGLHPLAAGRIDNGGNRIALLPQGSQLDRSFPITCLDVVGLAAPRLGWFRQASSSQLTTARAAMGRVGLAGFEARSVQALSAGQFQRLLFARTIVQDAPVILMDEPLTAVDQDTAELLLSVMQDWHAQRRTLIVVLHDMELVGRHFPRTLLLTGDGGHVWDTTATVGPIVPRQAA